MGDLTRSATDRAAGGENGATRDADEPEGVTGDVRLTRNSPAWQRYRAARTLAHHATDARDLAELLDMLGLTAAEGRMQPTETAPEQTSQPAALADDSSERLTSLLRDVLPSARRHAV